MRDSGKEKSSQKLLVRPSLTYEAPRTQYVETVANGVKGQNL